MSGTKLRVGIIGCGGMARHHIDGYLATGRYEVAALADLSEPAMRHATSLSTIFSTRPSRATKTTSMGNRMPQV